jgi:hypothetical protein
MSSRNQVFLTFFFCLQTEGYGNINISVADPDPYVFGPPGSGSFYHQAKIGLLDPDPSIIKQK